MSLSAAVIRELVAAGLAGDALVAACERIEMAAAPAPRTARQERNARYYEARQERLKASEKRLKTSDVLDPSSPLVPPASLSPETPIPPPPYNPPTTLVPAPSADTPALPIQLDLVGEDDTPSRGKYSDQFELLWGEYPKAANQSKADAWKAYRRLKAPDRQAALDGAMAYAAYIERETAAAKLNPYARPPPVAHLSTFLNGRRWETWNEK
jgi:hypothetical protein